jgi:hypothetical protein
MLYLPYRLSDCLLLVIAVLSKLKTAILKKETFFFLSHIPFIFHSVPPFPYLFHPSYFPSVFIQYFSPFLSLPLFHFATSIPHVKCSIVSFFSWHVCTFFPLILFSFSSFPQHFFLFWTPPPRYSGISSVIHLSHPCCI